MEWLHYVGMSRYKTREAFIEESRRLGTARRVPANMLGSLSWGDKVWLAEWLGSEGILTVEESGEAVQKRFAKGRAEIFAYFPIHRIAVEDPEVNAELLRQLQAEGKIERVEASAPLSVYRACGSYTQGGSVAVTASPQEIAEKVRDIPNGKKAKLTVMGAIQEVRPFTRLFPFHEGLIRYRDTSTYDTEGDLVEITDHRIVWTEKEAKALPAPKVGQARLEVEVG